MGALTGLLVGGAYGYVAQRGKFCMNSGFRAAVAIRETTQTKALALAIAVQMVLVPLAFLAGISQPTYPSFFPLAAIVGGLLFGLAMHPAGGCAAGVFYKLGGRAPGALVAVLGMVLGAALLEVGPLRAAREVVQGSAVATPSIPWVAVSVAGVVLLLVLTRAAPGVTGDWSWRRTGLLMGAVGAVAWPLSSLAGRDFGMAVIPGAVGLVTASGLDWDVLFVLGIAAGAFVAVRGHAPSERKRMTWSSAGRRLLGGFGLGVGASLAAGCTVGHGLTGVALLGPGSLLVLASIFAGSAAGTLWRRRRSAPEVLGEDVRHRDDTQA